VCPGSTHMEPKKLFADSRLSGFCVYCGGQPDTRDHVPSRVLLDEPFPANLPVVECCTDCNRSFSLHEEYVACFLSCVVCGSAASEKQIRPKIARILGESPALAARIQSSMLPTSSNQPIWSPDLDRFRSVVVKLARGHIAYELRLPKTGEPISIQMKPLALMPPESVATFLSDKPTPFWPEIGSRAFIQACKTFEHLSADSWRIVQPGRYQYLVSQSHGDFVRMLIADYLACEVCWE
jgi:hypothetical protein